MNAGYVALLDVLGFSALLGSDPTGERIRSYLACLEQATRDSEVDYVVFSDSVVLTAKGDGAESLAAVAGACSRLLSDLLNEGIALRGAIAFGSFFRSAIGESVFVAGRAVVDAYQFEQEQDWVGVMVAPSALARVPDLETRCLLAGYNSPEGLQSLRSRFAWAAVIQPCHGIPFHTASPFESSNFDGYAVVPTNGVLDPAPLRDSISAAMNRLKWLRAIAPTPAAQSKYRATLNWLYSIQQEWEDIARCQEQWGTQ